MGNGLTTGEGIRFPPEPPTTMVSANTDIVRVAKDICSSMLCAAVRSALLLDEVRTARSVVLLLGCIDRWRVEPEMGSSTASACKTMLAPSALGKGIPNVTVNTSSCIDYGRFKVIYKCELNRQYIRK